MKDNGFRWSTATASWNLPADLDEHTRTARVGELLSTVRANGRDLTVVNDPIPTSLRCWSDGERRSGTVRDRNRVAPTVGSVTVTDRAT